MELISQFEAQLSIVPRWSIVHTIQKQSVAEHSFRVALMAPRVYKKLFGDFPGPASELVLVQAALLHDQWESFTGDIPSPAKKPMLYDKKHLEEHYAPYVKCNPRIGDGSAATALRIADLIEGMIFMKQETALGNSTVMWILQDLEARVREILEGCGKAEWHLRLMGWLDTIQQQDPLDQRSPRVRVLPNAS